MDEPEFIGIDGIRTRYFKAGEGDPLVLVHGGEFGSFGSAYDWSLNFDELSKRFCVYAVDKLGHGFTDNPSSDEGYTMKETTNHLRKFLMAIDVQPALLVGHSRGALPVARIATDNPEMVRALVLVDTNTLAPDHPSTPTDFYAKLDEDAPSIPDEQFVRRMPEANSYSNEHISSDFVREMLTIARLDKTQVARETMARLAVRQFRPDVRREKYETLDRIREGHLKTPTLIVWGLNDPSAPIFLGYSLFEHVALAVPNVQFHVYNHAGHYPFREHARDFNKVVRNFVQGLHQ